MGKKRSANDISTDVDTSDKENNATLAQIGPRKQARCKWSDEDNRIMVQALMELKEAGQQADSGWKSSAWKVVADKLAVSGTKGPQKTANRCADHFSNVRTLLLFVGTDH
jgi:hypothetical protein